jgi:type I restriction enzyme, R subunit
VSFTKGRIIVRGKLHTRGEQKRAEYILYRKSDIPLAVIEAKDNNHSVGAGIGKFFARTRGRHAVFP